MSEHISTNINMKKKTTLNQQRDKESNESPNSEDNNSRKTQKTRNEKDGPLLQCKDKTFLLQYPAEMCIFGALSVNRA